MWCYGTVPLVQSDPVQPSAQAQRPLTWWHRPLSHWHRSWHPDPKRPSGHTAKERTINNCQSNLHSTTFKASPFFFTTALSEL